jgi:hypothetical protein
MPQANQRYFIALYPHACQPHAVFAPRDCYQVFDKFLDNWLTMAGVPPIKEVWQKAKKEHQLWIYHTGKSTC